MELTTSFVSIEVSAYETELQANAFGGDQCSGDTVEEQNCHPASCPTPAVFEKLTQTACAGRNELPTQSGISLADAKAYCTNTPACTSFENMSGNTCTASCKFQFSTSCTQATSAHYANYALFVKA